MSEGRPKITETAISLHGWGPGVDVDRRHVIEEDLRSLMRRVADLGQAAEESDRRHRARQRDQLLGVIAVLDAFDRVFEAIRSKQELVTPQMKIWVGNFRAVRRVLEQVLDEQGVSKLETVGGDFDPRWHRMAETVTDPSRPDGMVVDEVSPGYLWDGQLLRKAEVRVARQEDADRRG